jgi:hypothetical protein
LQIRRQIIGWKSLDCHLNQAEEWATEIRTRSAAAVDDDSDAHDFAAVLPDDVDCFLHAAAAGDDVFGYDEAFVRRNLEAAPEDEAASFLFGKDMAFAQGTSHFLPDNDSTESWRNDSIALNSAEFIGELAADARRDLGMLEEERTLEELPAVQARAEQEMSVEQRARFSEKRQQIVAHFPFFIQKLDARKLVPPRL